MFRNPTYPHIGHQEGFWYLPNLVQLTCSKSLIGGHGHTLMAAVVSRMANKKLEQASTALSKKRKEKENYVGRGNPPYIN
eukprot:167985-Pelagomonas_calceolata.AAC.1